ncbi:MAG: SAM-dependent methyltransferase, partial [Actinomycetia bacterium]|nr:SAM-dependent methyltransferase [Actinomycetes bacterium]
ICDWFAAGGFELLGVSEPGTRWGVGAHRFAGAPVPLPAGQRMFTFAGHDVARGSAVAGGPPGGRRVDAPGAGGLVPGGRPG